MSDSSGSQEFHKLVEALKHQGHSHENAMLIAAQQHYEQSKSKSARPVQEQNPYRLPLMVLLALLLGLLVLINRTPDAPPSQPQPVQTLQTE